MMEQDPLYWQSEVMRRLEEGKALADMLMSFDGQTPLDGMFSDLSRRSAPPHVAAETIRRLTAVFQEQVGRAAARLEAACCALYLVGPSLNEGAPEARRYLGGHLGRKDSRPFAASGSPSLSLRALYGASWRQDHTRQGMPVAYDGPAMQALVKRTVVMSDEADPPLLQEWARMQQVQRWLYVPIWGRASAWLNGSHAAPLPRSLAHDDAVRPQDDAPTTVLGVLAVGRRGGAKESEFTKADIRALSEQGDYLALAIELIRLGEQVDVGRELGKRYQEVASSVVERERVIQELDEGVLLVAPFGRILHLNVRGRELLGWPPSAGTPDAPALVQDYVPVELRTILDEVLLMEDWPMFRALHGERFINEEVRYRGPDGRERLLIFSGRPLFDAKGGIESALLSFHQATSEQEARAELEQIARYADQRALYVGSVLEAMTDSLMVCNPHGDLLLVNPAGKQMLGLGQTRLASGQYHIARFVMDFQVRTLSGQPLAVDDFPMMRALRGETVHDMELSLRRPDTGYEWQAHVSASPIKAGAESGLGVGAVAVLVDVTKARSLDRAKDEFLALSAHELKGPLTSIRGFAQLLRRGTKQAPDGVERRTDMQWVEKIEAQADRLGKLIEELTDAARADLGRFDLKVREVPLGALLRRVAEAQQVTTPKHKVTVEAPSTGLFVLGDETRLEQVFSNLVANAIKYAPGGGDVTIEVISQESEQTPSYIEVVIRDQGQGIAPSDLERIFTRFTRADSMRGVQGLGLGLYIARAIIESHGGTIRAESEGLGQGSTFVVRLPREERA
jgi:signal transduction histidine kinase